MTGGGKGRFFYGWVVVAASVCAVFAGTAVAPPSFSFFITPMSAEFGWSRTLISGAHSFGTLVAALASPVVGRIVDRYGSRWVMACGAIVMGAALATLSQVGTIVAFYAGIGLSRAIAQSVMDTGATLSVANWFVTGRPRALSMLNLGRGIGGFIMPLLAYVAMVNFGGWRASWLAIGAAVIAAGFLPTGIFLRRRPEDVGLAPDGMRPAEPAPTGSKATVRPAERETAFTFKDAVHSASFWLLTVAMFSRGMSAPGIVVHTMPYLLGKGVDTAEAATIVAVYAACLAAGGLFWGFLAQRVRVKYCLAGSFACAAMGVAVLLNLTTVSAGFVYAVVFGSSLGGIFTLEGVLWANYFGRAALGAIYGTAMTILLVGITLGPLVSGLSYDLLGGYEAAFLLFAFGMVLCAALILLSRPPRRATPNIQ